MKRVFVVLLLALGLAAGACAQTDMRVFVARNAMESSMAHRLVALLAREYPQARWSLEIEGEESLRQQVFADRAPDLAICSPGEARLWAQEGLLLPLTDVLRGQEQIEPQVLACCMDEEELFMAPLRTRQRQMAVNQDMMSSRRLGYLLGEVEHPVWYMTQFQQILEEFMLAGAPAFEVWPPRTDSSAGIEALLQAVYGGMLTESADSPEIRAAVKWLREMILSGMIGYAPDRETALRRFLDGKTPIFIDWTEETETAFADEIRKRELHLKETPYPSSTGELIRVFDVTGIAAFADADDTAAGLAVAAVAFLHTDEQAQRILGERLIRTDEALWMPDLAADGRGSVLRALFAGALCTVIEEKADADMVLELLQAAAEMSTDAQEKTGKETAG